MTPAEPRLETPSDPDEPGSRGAAVADSEQPRVTLVERPDAEAGADEVPGGGPDQHPADGGGPDLGPADGGGADLDPADGGAMNGAGPNHAAMNGGSGSGAPRRGGSGSGGSDSGGGPPAAQPSTRPRGWRPHWPTWRRDCLVFGLFLLVGVWVTSQIWLSPARRVAPLYSSDPAQVQFFLAHSVRVVLHGEFPFFTDRLNYPDGVNLMANTAILGLGIPMVPVTVLFGPAVSFVVLVTLGLAGTGYAWYYMLSRHVVRTPLAAVVGGWFLGFSPAMLSHANWHPNIISQFLLPFIVWRVIALTRSRRPVRDGVLLALLVTYQAFINEEILLFTALACAVFLLAVVLQQPGRWRAAWRPLTVGVLVCGALTAALLAYPLHVQFAGPQAYHGLSDAVQNYGNDLAAFVNPGSATLGGNQRGNANLAPNFSEENAFFGWGLALLAVGVVVWLWREALVRALAGTGLFFAVLSLGERVSYWNQGSVWGPWDWLVRAPLLDAVVPTRFGLITTAVIGVLLAMAVDRAWSIRVADRRLLRGVVVAGLAVALVPIAPIPLREVHRPAPPAFITSGLWKPYVGPDQTVVPVPVPAMGHSNGMRWAAATDLGFKIPGGYFLAPRNGNTGDPGRFGGRPSGIGELLDEVASTGRSVTPSDRQRRRSLDELRTWHAAILVLPVSEHNADALRRTVEQLVGPAKRQSDVWVWDVRPLSSRSS